MSDFDTPRITEKRYLEIGQEVLTANGTVDGLISIASTYSIKVGQVLTFKSNTQEKRAKVQRVISDTQFYVIEEKDPVTTKNKLDMSMFLVVDSAFLRSSEDKRPVIDLLEIQRQVYEEEPTVALRTHAVDWLGRSYDKSNPVPVQLSDGSINIGSVNAELEVQLSHIDNNPDAGDVHDSVRIGDGEDQLEINPDGSINISSTDAVSLPTILNIPVTLANNEYSFILPATTKRFEFRLRDNGASKAQIAYTAGQSNTVFWTVYPGSTYSESKLKLSSAVTIYFQSTKPLIDAEVKYWE